MSYRRFCPVGLIALAFIASIACERVEREMLESNSTIPLEGIQSSEVRIRPGAGEVFVKGGDIGALMKAGFRYNRRHWEPRVDFFESGGRGRLIVERRRSRTFLLGRVRNTWDIELTNRIPLDLDFDFGAGEARLDLSGLRLRSLAIDMGVGELILDLTGDRSESLEASIDGGIGHATVLLPFEIGVRVRIDGGLGSIAAPGFTNNGHVYTNAAYGRTKVRIDLEINAGIGQIDLKMRGGSAASF
jgi:hypothetical protein